MGRKNRGNSQPDNQEEDDDEPAAVEVQDSLLGQQDGDNNDDMDFQEVQPSKDDEPLGANEETPLQG